MTYKPQPQNEMETSLHELASHLCQACGVEYIGFSRPAADDPVEGYDYHRDKYHHLVLHYTPNWAYEYLFQFNIGKATFAFFASDFNRDNVKAKVIEYNKTRGVYE